MQTKFDTLDFIIRFEQGDCESQEEVIEGFQALIDSGLAWQLQGSYGRAARQLINAGYCTDPREVQA